MRKCSLLTKLTSDQWKLVFYIVIGVGIINWSEFVKFGDLEIPVGTAAAGWTPHCRDGPFGALDPPPLSAQNMRICAGKL